MPDLIVSTRLWWIPLIFAISMTGEIWILRKRSPAAYAFRETLASTAILIGQLLLRPLSTTLVLPIFVAAYAHRIATIPVDCTEAVAALFLATEFAYYWMHRASHRIGWLWASHAVHHSSTHINFSAAYRLGWTQALSGSWLFFLPLAWLGFAPVSIFAALAANLLFQFFLHTETIGRLGPLEWILNTPSHHRVHHAAEGVPHDRNFGGVLIVFDRLFGTFTPEPATGVFIYGLVGRPVSHNPLVIAFAGWWSLACALGRVRTARSAVRVVLGPSRA